MQALALKILILSLSAATVFGIHCYDCNSKFEEQCKDPFNRFPLANLNCDTKPMHPNRTDIPATFCRKTYQKVNDEVRIIRACGYISDSERKGACRRTSPSKGVEIITCECYEDLCNKSHKMHATLLSAVFATIIFAVTRIFL